MRMSELAIHGSRGADRDDDVADRWAHHERSRGVVAGPWPEDDTASSARALLRPEDAWNFDNASEGQMQTGPIGSQPAIGDQ